MYNFIFNFFYRYHKKGKDFSPRFTAAGAVAITIFFHLFLVVNIITYFTGFNLAGKPFSQDYFINKLYMLPFGLVYLYSFVLFYTHKRAMAIVNKYPQDYKVITFKNVLLVLLIMIVPLLIGIQFLQHSH
ncbi:MAG: hypothetical protein EAZ47_09465 [Bacteroidetes bacterium]|nr:MAG: hypothetical protein EAY72_13470 [Bacteroidota bacterium]TAE63893.1 MAG: hypothetical protein EAY68_07570 [Bacteroidota bacterium]TAF91852.1 MAG: hypothetical protein EAZ47_09465 [Bacteroidota bacterium]